MCCRAPDASANALAVAEAAVTVPAIAFIIPWQGLVTRTRPGLTNLEFGSVTDHPSHESSAFVNFMISLCGWPRQRSKPTVLADSASDSLAARARAPDVTRAIQRPGTVLVAELSSCSHPYGIRPPAIRFVHLPRSAPHSSGAQAVRVCPAAGSDGDS